MTQKYNEDVKSYVKRMVDTMNSFELQNFYCRNVLTSLGMTGADEYLLKGNRDDITNFYLLYNKFLNDKELTILKIPNEITSTLQDTENKIFYRPLFDTNIFLDIEFEFGDKMFKGIGLSDMPNKKYVSVFLTYFDKKDYSENYYAFKLCDDYEEFDKQIFTTSESRYVTKLRHMICNILDLIDDDSLITKVTIVKDAKTNEKRVRKGKLAIPTKIVIKPRTEFKEYLNKYNSGESNYSHSFKVRGHFMHFRSEKYSLAVRGTKKFVKPYWKNTDAIRIKKDYEMKK